MVQVKKADIKESILDTAFVLFREGSYSDTTLAQIGKAAGVTVSNIYNYYDSKFAILFAAYEPWLLAQLEGLPEMVEAEPDVRAKLNRVFLTILHDIPKADSGFANNFIQAIATRKPGEAYSRNLLLEVEVRVTSILRDIVPGAPNVLFQDDRLTHLLFMAFDGFAITHNLTGPSRRAEAICDMLTDLVIGVAEAKTA